jgi:hypothetical protein
MGSSEWLGATHQRRNDMDEYEIQFVERNANIDVNNPNSYGRRVAPGSRAIIRQPGAGQPQVIYAHPGVGAGLGGSALFGRMTTGGVIDMVAQIFAALMPLPTAPVATNDPATDVGNLILYQSSLAQYAKRDEQVRTVGNLIVKLVG